MNREETKAIIKILYCNFMQYNKNDDEQLTGLIGSWASCFADDSYQDVAQALKYYLSTDTSGFPPTIAALKNNIIKIHSPMTLDAVSAWMLVKKSLSNSLYNATAEFNKLPTAIKLVVGSATTLRSWAQCETSQIDTVIASNFQKNYREMVLKEKEQAMLPNSLKNLIESNGMTYIGDNQLKLPKNEKVEFDREAVMRRIEASKKGE